MIGYNPDNFTDEEREEIIGLFPVPRPDDWDPEASRVRFVEIVLQSEERARKQRKANK